MHKASSSPSLPSVVGLHWSHPRRQPLSHSVPALPDDMHRERSCPKPTWDFGDRKEGKTIHSNNIYKNWAKYSRSFKSCSTSQHKLVHFQHHKRLPCLTAGRTSSQFRGTDSKRTFKGVDLSTARCWHWWLKQSKWHLHPGKFDTMRCSTFESTHFFNGTFEKWKTPPARDMGFLQWVIRIPMQLGSRVPYTKQATRVDRSQDIWGSISTLQEDTLSLQGTRCACLIGKCLILAAIDRTFWIHIRYFLISANQG